MAYSINVTKRTNGGFTIATEDYTYYASAIVYHGTAVGVTLYSRGLTTKLYKPTEWTIQTVTGFTTIAQVCDALDTLGIVSGDPLSDMVTLLTTIDGDTGNIVADVSVIKTALEIIDNFISGSRGLVTEDNSADIKTAANTIMGQDFLCISDTNAHGTLDCTMIYVMADAVFSDITVGGSNVVTAKGLNSLTIKEGTMLTFGKAHVTSITLASGTVIAYIN